MLDIVTINAGVRYDSQLIYNNAGALNLAFPNEWSPRIGLVWDPPQAGHAKVYASFSRYFESVPLDMADRALSGEPQLRAIHTRVPDTQGDRGCNPLTISGHCSYTKNLQVLDPTQPNRHYLAYGADSELIDPNIKPPSSDEFVVGGEYEVLPAARCGRSHCRPSIVACGATASRSS